MFKFKTQQKVFEIGKIKVGGQPGENPTVLVGSIFYRGHKIVTDDKAGELKKEEAEKIISTQQEFSDKTRNPAMLDVVGSTVVAMEKFIDFTAKATDSPLIDSPSVEVKLAGVKYAKEVGLEKRVVYNSLVAESKPEEFETLKENGVESAILLAYKSAVMTSKSRVNVIREIFSKAEKTGITKPLVDTFALDIPSLSMACRSVLDLKNELGLPCGCGSHNAFATWSGFKKLMGSEAVIPTSVTVNMMPIVLGADFILYGPVEDCRYVFPSVYAVNTSYKYIYKMKEQLAL